MFVANLIEKGKNSFFGRKSPDCRIVIERNTVRIISESGMIDKEININSETKISMRDRYDIPFGRLPETFAEVRGIHSKNKLHLENEGQSQKFEFAINSALGIERLKKEILYWKSLGYEVNEGL